jgi:hypothetical protein
MGKSSTVGGQNFDADILATSRAWKIFRAPALPAICGADGQFGPLRTGRV